LPTDLTETLTLRRELQALQQRLEQTTVEHHLALSYFIEAETRKNYDKIDPSINSFTASKYSSSSSTKIHQETVDNHLMLSYLLQAQTLQRDLNSECEKSAYQRTVDEQLMLSYHLEAKTLKNYHEKEREQWQRERNELKRELENSKKTAYYAFGSDVCSTCKMRDQKTVDDHLTLSYKCEAEFWKKQEEIQEYNRKEAEKENTLMQSYVDQHLMFSYMSEAQGWKKEVERLERGKIKKIALFLGHSANGLFPFPLTSCRSPKGRGWAFDVFLHVGGKWLEKRSGET
jgi:hypothetical protein